MPRRSAVPNVRGKYKVLAFVLGMSAYRCPRYSFARCRLIR